MLGAPAHTRVYITATYAPDTMPRFTTGFEFLTFLQSAGEESLKKYERRLQTVKADATREIDREKEKYAPKPEPKTIADNRPQISRLAEGQKVRVKSLGVTGIISLIKDGEAEVLMGNIKLRRQWMTSTPSSRFRSIFPKGYTLPSPRSSSIATRST